MNDKINSTEKFRRANFWVCVSAAIVVLYAIAREYFGFANEMDFAIWGFFLTVLATIIANICGKKVAQPDLISRDRFLILVAGIPCMIIMPDIALVITPDMALDSVKEKPDIEAIYIHVYLACMIFIITWMVIRNVYLTPTKIKEISVIRWLFCIIMIFLSLGGFFVFGYYEFNLKFLWLFGFINMLISVMPIDPLFFKRQLNKMFRKVGK